MKCRFTLSTWLRRLVLACAIFCAAAGNGLAVIHLDTGDPALYTTTPGDNSGWQYEGLFGAYIGTPIAPYYFVTAKHIGGNVGDPFVFHGKVFTTTAVAGDPSTDLQIWKVDQPFAVYAPIYQPNATADAETGQELRVHGRGTQRGGEIDLGGTPRGWVWGGSDNVERWGRNLVTAVLPSGSPGWSFLQVAFDSPGVPDEAHLSVGDSGGGVFILQNGLWRLAGINYGVDGLFTKADAGSGFSAAIFDARGFYMENDDQTFSLITGDANVPTCFYSTQVSARFAWIEGVVGNIETLPTEDFAAWQQAYFTPDQLADNTFSGPNADPDGDGVPNLLEFAFNLDPTFPGPVVMTAGTGLRGLPLIQPETVAASDRRLTVEFVRRTASSMSGVTYAVQFTSDLGGGWQTGGTESVTAINERWERVKVTDTVSIGATVQARFARVSVNQNVAASPDASAPVASRKRK